MVPAVAAPVRPRVCLSGVSEAVLLEDEVRERIDGGRWGIVELVGLPGSGKSVALAHLAHSFAGDERLRLLEGPNRRTCRGLVREGLERLVVCAQFQEGVLKGSHLTGSQMPSANFRGANLRSTGLAEIDWPNADLREADLRGATFHMGSSRSGLVGSPIACEGSRTGFYTDEFNEQDFRSPEDIRKANLCGADLRGAIIEDVDFYLVDLRGAKYTKDQEPQLRATGAILETRV